jgi:4-amino-4-deoxy-L-arabinose transferase-like glycosyltransferase
MAKRNEKAIIKFVKEVFLNRNFYWLLLVLSIFAALKIVVAVHFELNSEEAQYWTWSKHLQLSYYSKPPMIAYLNWLSTSVFGDTVLGVRINAVIIGLLTSIVSYILAFELFKNTKTALVTAVVTNIFPFLLSSSIFFTTDTPLLFFWICAMLFYWKAVETNKSLWWILFGISIGLGSLSKYSIFLILIPLVLFSWKYHREILKTRNFYLSIFIGLIIFSPVIFWNIRNNGVGALHLVHLAGVDDHPHSAGKIASNVFDFIIGQMAILLPFYQYKKIFRKYRQKALTRQEEFLIFPAFCMFIVFLFVSINRDSGAYINWAMYAYMGIPLLFAHFVLSENKMRLNLGISILMALGFFLFVSLTSPSNKTLPLRELNPANKMIGWAQLAKKVDSMKTALPSGSYYVFSPNYHITSELWFYLKGHPETYLLNTCSRMTQYDLWPGLEQFINSGKTGIFVDLERITPEIKADYNTILKEDSCAVFSQDRCIYTYHIYFLQGLKGFHKQYSSY